MKIKGRIIGILKVLLAVVLVLTAGFCVSRRLPECFASRDGAALAAAAFTLTDGSYRLEAGEEQATTAPEPEEDTRVSRRKTAVPASEITSGVRDKSGYYDSSADHTGEREIAVEERNISGDGTLVGGAYIKNRTGIAFDFESYLSEPLSFSVGKGGAEPQVLIYHTHTGEGYLDADVDKCFESYYSHTYNNDFNVVAVGEAIKRSLEENGIATLHDPTVHDSTYSGSYYRSAETASADMADYPSIKIVLDIHRDAIGTDDCKTKPVFEYEGRKGAQIMILSGCDYYGEMDFPDWEKNLSLALKLQTTAERLYPGMTRPLSFDYFSYNEPLCDGSLLIEIGSEANSIDEAEYTGELLGKAIAEATKDNE